jgi:hypothetical protein
VVKFENKQHFVCCFNLTFKRPLKRSKVSTETYERPVGLSKVSTVTLQRIMEPTKSYGITNFVHFQGHTHIYFVHFQGLSPNMTNSAHTYILCPFSRADGITNYPNNMISRYSYSNIATPKKLVDF